MKELIYDVHASESGALAILNDLYSKLRDTSDNNTEYLFVVSTPRYEETDNIKVVRYPWVKKSWLHRLYFDHIVTRKIIKEFQPDKVYSLQNKGIPFFHGEQEVYLHLPFILCDYRFNIKKDGKRLWLYQNVLSKSIFRSLRNVDKVIVQTKWMKEALVHKANVAAEHIEIQMPDITMNQIGEYIDIQENRRNFVYPATAFHYKNHMTILKALVYAKQRGLTDYKVLFTIKEDENNYTRELYRYTQEHQLNVKFLGQIPRETVFRIYTNSVLLFPSFVESFGLPLLEGRLSGTYILASDCPFCREILDGYDKSVFFDALDDSALGKAILQLVRSS